MGKYSKKIMCPLIQSKAARIFMGHSGEVLQSFNRKKRKKLKSQLYNGFRKVTCWVFDPAHMSYKVILHNITLPKTIEKSTFSLEVRSISGSIDFSPTRIAKRKNAISLVKHMVAKRTNTISLIKIPDTRRKSAILLATLASKRKTCKVWNQT